MSGLLVIGDVVTDVVALHDGPAATGTDTPADIALHPGGSGANTASWAARLGADTRLLARAGYDTGEWHAAQLTKAGVRPHLRIDPERPSAVVIAMVDSTGERSMLTNRGASGHIGVGDWTPDLLDGVGHLHVSAYTMFAEPGLELVRLAMREAAGRGITISVDPASSGPLRAFGPERFLRESAPASIVIPNLEEALLLADAADPETAMRHAQRPLRDGCGEAGGRWCPAGPRWPYSRQSGRAHGGGRRLDGRGRRVRRGVPGRLHGRGHARGSPA